MPAILIVFMGIYGISSTVFAYFADQNAKCCPLYCAGYDENHWIIMFKQLFNPLVEKL
jgi:hypothetical protein